MAICPIIVHHYVARALMHDVTCEPECSARMRQALHKQSARTSLKGARTLAKRQNEVFQLPEVPQDAKNNGVWNYSILHCISRARRKQWHICLRSL